MYKCFDSLRFFYHMKGGGSGVGEAPLRERPLNDLVVWVLMFPYAREGGLGGAKPSPGSDPQNGPTNDLVVGGLREAKPLLGIDTENRRVGVCLLISPCERGGF